MGNLSWLLSCLVSLILGIGWTHVEASIHSYNHRRIPCDARSDACSMVAGREGLFASGSAKLLAGSLLLAKGPNDGKTQIKFDKLKFKRPYDGNADTAAERVVNVVIFEGSDIQNIGYAPREGAQMGDSRYFCCTEELKSNTNCTMGGVVVSTHEQGDMRWPHVIPFTFFGDATEVESPITVEIKKTGMYYVLFVVCDKELPEVYVDGETIWKNPMGYLPGMTAPLMTFYAFMALAYLALGFIWFAQYVRYWKDILQLQNCITIVVALGMSEMATWYFDFVNFNSTGLRPIGITMWAVLLGAVRKALSRMLILVVSMGYGVVRPTLGGLTKKVLFLGITDFVAICSLDMMQHVGTIDDPTPTVRMFLVLPVAVLDAVFILWIFTSLSRTLSQLQMRRQTAKLELYRRFTNILAVAVVTSVAWIAYEFYIKVANQYVENWEMDWVITSFWHILNFVLLCGICYLWAPNQNSTRYAYSEDAVDDDEDSETAPLKGGAAKKVTAMVDLPSDSGAAKVDKPQQPVNKDVFSIDDDMEEGKLE